MDAATAPSPGSAARRAVFLDKDGTLLRDVPYNVDPALIEFTPNALAGIERLAAAGFAFFIVTNQPGLASGRFSRREFALLEAALRARVEAECGIRIEALFCCPHLPGGDGRPACLCRKPAPGLLRQAALAHGLDLGRSWMIGDILDDIEAGHRAGCRAILLDVGNETEWKLSPSRRPDAVTPDLLAAAQFIESADAPRRANGC